MDSWLIAIVAAGAGLFGALAGSLIHTFAVRLPANLALFGSPICVHCATPAPAVALMPGRSIACSSCGHDDNTHKLATEVAGALLAMLALLAHGISFTGLSVALFCLLLLLILRIDWQHHLIFTATIGPGMLLAFGLAAAESLGALLSALLAAAAAAVLFGLFYILAVVIYRQRALGFGDILLVALIGAMTGLEQVVPAIFLGMILAAVGGLLLVALGRRTRRDYIPYGAYLCLGSILVLLFG